MHIATKKDSSALGLCDLSRFWPAGFPIMVLALSKVGLNIKRKRKLLERGGEDDI